jgi:hypothetical protein
MIRFLVIVAALAMPMGAQTAGSPGSCPIEVTGRVASIDPHKWVGFEAGPGLFIEVRNISGKGIQGYVFETAFMDPATRQNAGGRREHSAWKEPGKGVELAAGEGQELPKPYPLPKTASGSMAQYSFKVDLVIFDDGSKWGPGQLRSSMKMVTSLSATK